MRYIIILALLAVAAGCSNNRTIEGHEYIGIWDGRGLDYVHSESCPNPVHKKDEGPHPVDWKTQIELAANESITVTGSIVFEHDTMNRLMSRVDYACAQGFMPDGSPAYFRLEMQEDSYGVFKPTPVLHIHTCATQADTCRLRFDERGYYAGCNCGGNESIIGLP